MSTPSREQIEQWAREADECAVREAEKRHLSSRTWYDIRDEHFARLVRAAALEEAKAVVNGGSFLHPDAPTAIWARDVTKLIDALAEKEPKP